MLSDFQRRARNALMMALPEVCGDAIGDLLEDVRSVRGRHAIWTALPDGTTTLVLDPYEEVERVVTAWARARHLGAPWFVERLLGIVYRVAEGDDWRRPELWLQAERESGGMRQGLDEDGHALNQQAVWFVRWQCGESAPDIARDDRVGRVEDALEHFAMLIGVPRRAVRKRSAPGS